MNVKLSDSQLKKLKNAVTNKTGTILRISLKMFAKNDVPHELFFTERRKTKLRNTFNNNMSTDLKISKAQISKIIQSGEFLESLLSKLGGPLMKVAIPFSKKCFSTKKELQLPLQQLLQEFRKKNVWFWNNNFNNFRWGNKWYNENCSSSWRL